MAESNRASSKRSGGSAKNAPAVKVVSTFSSAIKVVDKTYNAAAQKAAELRDASKEHIANQGIASASQPKINPYNTQDFPAEWKIHDKKLPQPVTVPMDCSFENHLPKVRVTVHSANNLKTDTSYVELTFGIPPTKKLKTPEVKGSHPVFDTTQDLVLHKVNVPTMAFIRVYTSSKVGKVLLGQCDIDTQNDLHLLNKGDERKWTFKLAPQGEVTVSFLALDPIQFPAICVPKKGSFDGMTALDTTVDPQFQIILYQIVGLRAPKAITIACECFHEVYKPDGTYETNKLFSTSFLKTFYPFWNVLGTFGVLTKNDKIVFYLVEKQKIGERKTNILEIDVKTLLQYASVEESTNWFVLEKGVRPGFMGLGIKALSNVAGCYDELPNVRLTNANSIVDMLSPEERAKLKRYPLIGASDNKVREQKPKKSVPEAAPTTSAPEPPTIARAPSRVGMTKNNENEIDEILAWMEYEEAPPESLRLDEEDEVDKHENDDEFEEASQESEESVDDLPVPIRGSSKQANVQMPVIQERVIETSYYYEPEPELEPEPEIQTPIVQPMYHEDVIQTPIPKSNSYMRSSGSLNRNYQPEVAPEPAKPLSQPISAHHPVFQQQPFLPGQAQKPVVSPASQWASPREERKTATPRVVEGRARITAPKKQSGPCILCKNIFAAEHLTEYMTKFFCPDCMVLVQQREERLRMTELEKQQAVAESPRIPRMGSGIGISSQTGPGAAFLVNNEELFLQQQSQLLFKVNQIQQLLNFCTNPMQYQALQQELLMLKSQIQLSPQAIQELQNRVQISNMVAPIGIASPRVQVQLCDMCQMRQSSSQAAGKNICEVCRNQLLQDAVQKKESLQHVGPLCDLCQAAPAASKLLSKNLCGTCHITVMNKAKEKGIV